MKINQMKFQKLIVICAFIMACLTFVYAYSFATQFYPLSQDAAQMYLNDVGRNYYADIQPFNRTLATLSLVFVLVSVLLFVSISHKRRRYYLFNYIATGVYAVSAVAFSAFSFINIFKWMGTYGKINFTEVVGTMKENISLYPEGSALRNALQDELDKFVADVPTSTPIFIIGIVLFVLVLAAAALLIVNCVWKKKAMAKEDAEFAEEDARIRAAQAEHARQLEEDM